MKNSGIESYSRRLFMALEKSYGGKIENLRPTDEKHFYNLISASKISSFAFENNWAYILQATRNCPRKYSNHKSVIYLTTKHWECKGPIVVVNMLGNNFLQCLTELQDICLKKKKSIIIKNVDEKLKPNLYNLGFRETKEAWSKYSFRDDNTYPQMVFRVEDIIKRKEWKHANRNIINQYLRNPVIKTTFYNKGFAKVDRQLLKSYSRYGFEKGKDFEEEIYRAHIFFFDENIKNKIRLQHVRNGELVGVSFFTKIKDIAFWNALINIDESNIIRILFYESVRFLGKKYKKHLKYIMSQGSESEGQNRFKLSFRPIYIIPKTHMIYR